MGQQHLNYHALHAFHAHVLTGVLVCMFVAPLTCAERAVKITTGLRQKWLHQHQQAQQQKQRKPLGNRDIEHTDSFNTGSSHAAINVQVAPATDHLYLA